MSQQAPRHFVILSDRSGFWIEYEARGSLISSGPFASRDEALRAGERLGLTLLT